MKVRVRNAKETIMRTTKGKTIEKPKFSSSDEKKRASKIINLLKGLTVMEARHLLMKISEAIMDSAIGKKIT